MPRLPPAKNDMNADADSVCRVRYNRRPRDLFAGGGGCSHRYDPAQFDFAVAALQPNGNIFGGSVRLRPKPSVIRLASGRSTQTRPARARRWAPGTAGDPQLLNAGNPRRGDQFNRPTGFLRSSPPTRGTLDNFFRRRAGHRNIGAGPCRIPSLALQPTGRSLGGRGTRSGISSHVSGERPIHLRRRGDGYDHLSAAMPPAIALQPDGNIVAAGAPERTWRWFATAPTAAGHHFRRAQARRDCVTDIGSRQLPTRWCSGRKDRRRRAPS